MRDLFFPAPVFKPLDGDSFILQVHGVFTRIRSGLRWWRAAVARVDFQSTARQQQQQWTDTQMDLIQWLLLRGMKNPKGFSVHL
jgi:hypothetical protein